MDASLEELPASAATPLSFAAGTVHPCTCPPIEGSPFVCADNAFFAEEPVPICFLRGGSKSLRGSSFR
eukprot:12891035-Prorocentrum_lima.AAC.1